MVSVAALCMYLYLNGVCDCAMYVLISECVCAMYVDLNGICDCVMY